MKCPACSRALESAPAGTVMVDVCRGGCGGIWFDLRELKLMDEATEPVHPALLHVPRDPSVKIETGRRKCPKCDAVVMMRHPYSPRQPVEIDECPNCGGVWLDGGELERIRNVMSSAEAAALQQRLAETAAIAEVQVEGEVGKEKGLGALIRFLGWHRYKGAPGY